jgi:hypothetical protein
MLSAVFENQIICGKTLIEVFGHGMHVEHDSSLMEMFAKKRDRCGMIQ